MEIHSNYNNSMIDFDVMEKKEPTTGTTLIVIKHDSLRDVIYNKLSIAKNGSIEYNYINSSLDHAVVECTIKDGNGRVATEIGEAVPGTLENDIARNYPVLIASQRAFDRAAILFLGLAGKQFSNEEMGMFLPVDFDTAIDKQETTFDEVIDSSEDNEPYAQACINIPDGINDLVEEPEEEIMPKPVEEDNSEAAKRLEYLENYIPHVKNNETLTLKDWYERSDNDKEYLRKLTKIANPSPSIKEAVEHVKEYIKLIEG